MLFTKNYTPLTLSELGTDNQILATKLDSKIKKREITFLLGDCGSGKTTILSQMATQLGSNAVFYTVSKSTQSVDSLLYYLKETIKDKKQNQVWVLVDGFDQLREIWNGKSGESLIPLLLKGIKAWEMPEKDICLVLTARKQNFGHWPYYDQGVCQAYEILPLTPKQIMDIYKGLKSESLRYTGIYKVPNIFYSKSRLKYLLDRKIEGTILTNPFFLTYLDVILAYKDVDEIAALTYSQALDLILGQYWMIREYNDYLLASQQEEERYSISEYERWAQTVLILIVGRMMEETACVFSMEKLPEEYREYAKYRSRIVGHMMEEKNQETFWFKHDFILEFFAAQYLSNQSCSYRVRYRWLCERSLAYVMEMYRESLEKSDLIYSKLMQSLELSPGENPFESAHIVIKDKPRIFVIQILSYLVQVKTFTWQGMDFSRMDTNLLAEHSIVDLEGRGLTQLSLLNYIGYLKEVYADQNQITTLGDYRYNNDFKVLDITKNPFVNYDELKEFQLERLLISVNKKEQLESILQVAGSIKLVLDIPNMSFMYSQLFDLREKEGKDLTIRKGIITSKSILLRYLKVFKYTIGDLIKIYVMDSLHHDSNQRCIPLLQFLYKVMVNKETKRSLERTMIHMLAEMTIFSEIKEPVVWVETLWEESDQILAQLAGEALINLHLGAWYYARKEYRKAIKSMEHSGVIVNLTEECNIAQQQELIPIVCRFVPMDYYYDIYVAANEKAENEIEEITMEDGDIVLDNIYGELRLRAFKVLKKYNDEDMDLEDVLERMF